MNPPLLRHFAVTVLLTCALSCGHHQPAHAVSGGAKDPRLADRVHASVNDSRAGAGKRALQRDAYLDSLAVEHARQSMDRSAGRPARIGHAGFQSRFMRANSRIGAVMYGENVHCIPAGVADPARRFTDDWKASDSHRDNLLGSWNLTGVGVVNDPAGRIWGVQVFAAVP